MHPLTLGLLASVSFAIEWVFNGVNTYAVAIDPAGSDYVYANAYTHAHLRLSL